MSIETLKDLRAHIRQLDANPTDTEAWLTISLPLAAQLAGVEPTPETWRQCMKCGTKYNNVRFCVRCQNLTAPITRAASRAPTEESRCRSVFDGIRCDLPHGHEGAHIADLHDGNGAFLLNGCRVTHWPQDGWAVYPDDSGASE